MYYELTPAYGRDYKNKSEVVAAWEADKDFLGDYQLGFSYVNKSSIPKPCTVNLRFAKNRKVAVVKA